MHILVSFCNLRAPGVPALGLLNTTTLEFRVLKLPAETVHFNGVTGLALSDRYVYLAMQSMRIVAAVDAPVLLIFNRSDLSPAGHYRFQTGIDIHSLLALEDRLIVVSTGTDEILELGLRNAEVVSEVCLWRPDSDAPREDRNHLNAITLWHDDLLVSAFGPKTSGSWTSAKNGFVINVTTGEMLVPGLDQPHSLVNLGVGIACCESRKRSVFMIDGDCVQHLPGYTRGLSRMGDHLYVATSVGRRLSRGTGLINNPADDGFTEGRCTISRLSLATFEVEHTIELGEHASEIYDLLPVDEAANWPVVDEITWRNCSIRGLAGLLDQRTIWAKRATADNAQREVAISNLRQELDSQAARVRDLCTRNESLARETAEMLTANKRQHATLEALAFFVDLMRRAVADSVDLPE